MKSVGQGRLGYSAEWTKPSVPPTRVFVWPSKPGQTNVWVGDSSSGLPSVNHGAVSKSCCPNKPAQIETKKKTFKDFVRLTFLPIEEFYQKQFCWLMFVAVFSLINNSFFTELNLQKANKQLLCFVLPSSQSFAQSAVLISQRSEAEMVLGAAWGRAGFKTLYLALLSPRCNLGCR